MSDKYFAFADRTLDIVFFKDKPVTVRLCICKQTDELMDRLSRTVTESTEDYDSLYDLLREAAGDETAAELMSRTEAQDCYAVTQLLLYIHRSYLSGRSKNLMAAARGQTRTQE